MEIKNLIEEFMKKVGTQRDRIYNEASLQYELGTYLKKNLSADYKVEYERNTKYFDINGTVKHEIDIVVYRKAGEKFSDTIAIELKIPSMYSQGHTDDVWGMLKDIRFIEELKDKGFKHGYCIAFITEKDYKYFCTSEYRQNREGHHAYVDDLKLSRCFKAKKTYKQRNNDSSNAITLEQEREIVWNSLNNGVNYYIVEV